MRSFFEENKILNSVYFQIFIIIVAFFIMGLSGFLFVRNIERSNLSRNSINAITYTNNEIIKKFQEHFAILTGFSNSIRDMIISGDNEEDVSEYMKSSRASSIRSGINTDASSIIYGYFYAWGGKFLSGSNEAYDANFKAQEQEWYNAALEAAGEIAVTEHYISTWANKTVLILSQSITDFYGTPLGVVCLEIDIGRIFSEDYAIKITDNSYWMLTDGQLRILSHPETYLRGLRIHNVITGISKFMPELNQGNDILNKKISNYNRKNTVIFLKKINYDWYLGISIPVSDFNGRIIIITVLIFAIASVLAAILCYMLYQVSLAKSQSDIKTQQKSNFLATMSHEIRTPLNAILGMTEIQMQNASHPPATNEAFIKINNSGNLLLNIINDILDLSKIEAGKLELVPVKYDVASLINDIVQLNYIRYESKPIEFELVVDENTPSVLVGDELRIKQILNNLLSNAFKYTEKGKVSLSVTSECVVRGGTALVTLIFQVKDTGQGMTPDQVNKLFDEYTRFNLEANRTTEGAGLGMTITKNLVNLMYGKILVKSAVGEGTVVTVRLPQKTDGVGISGVIGKKMVETLENFRQGNALYYKKAKFSYEYMPYGKILIVDDVETNLYVAKGLMAPYGLQIDLAMSGFEAIEKVKEGVVYDIIFMDHMMPKMDGIEAARIIREAGYTHSIVALTANALAGQAEVFLRSGFDGFISKPIDIRQLNGVLNRLIRDKQPAEVVAAAREKKSEMDKKLEEEILSQQVDPKLAEIFIRDANKSLAALETSMKNNLQNEEDIQSYIINIHSMKSALANIKELKLSSAALKLEEAGRNKDIGIMLSETISFINELKIIIEKLSSNDTQEETQEDSSEMIALLNEKLLIIKNACREFDKKTAKNTLNELKEKQWSKKQKDLLNKISESLLHSEFEDAAALIEENL